MLDCFFFFKTKGVPVKSPSEQEVDERPRGGCGAVLLRALFEMGQFGFMGI